MEKHSLEANMTHGSVSGHLLRTAFPLLFGMLGFATLEIVDTWFLAKLSSDYVAALGYIFPMMAITMAMFVAFEAGTASVVSRALGEERQDLVKRYATDALLLALVTSLVLMGSVMWSMDWFMTLVNVPV